MVIHRSGYLKESSGWGFEGNHPETIAGSFSDQLEELIELIEQLMIKLSPILSGRRPQLLNGTMARSADRVKQAGSENLKLLAKKPQYLKKDLKSGFIRIDTDYYRPVKLIDTKSENNFNTKENQFLRWLLTRIRQMIGLLRTFLAQQGIDYDPVVSKRLVTLEGQITCCLHADFMTDVSEIWQIPTKLLKQMPQCYQGIYQGYVALMKGFKQISEHNKLKV